VIGWLSIRGDFPKALRTTNILDHTWRGLAGAFA